VFVSHVAKAHPSKVKDQSLLKASRALSGLGHAVEPLMGAVQELFSRVQRYEVLPKMEECADLLQHILESAERRAWV